MLLPTPADYLLHRDACSYGYFLLEPNHWDPATRTFTTTLGLDRHALTLRITQPAASGKARPARGSPLRLRPDRPLTPAQRRRLRDAVTRILRLDEPAETLAAFHAADPRFRRSGRGRLMRSATLFEDVLKTVTSCNVSWPSTIIMNRKLCRQFGRKSASGLHAFPSAARLARAQPSTLRARCSVGYRDARIVELAGLFARPPRRGGIDQAWLQDPGTPEDELYKSLLDLPGVGPYAAANILQLLGRYARLPLDTESVRHGRTVLGYKGTGPQVMKRVHKHFEPFGEHRFRSYWFELWEYYEHKRGPSHTWDRETTGKTFTAAKLD